MSIAKTGEFVLICVSTKLTDSTFVIVFQVEKKYPLFPGAKLSGKFREKDKLKNFNCNISTILLTGD